MAYTTPSEVLIREHLEDEVSNLFPAETPIQRMLAKVPMNQKVIEFGVDSFQITRTIASITANAQNENASATDDASELYPSRLRAVAQINHRAVTVSGTDRASVHAGISDPYEYRIYKKMVEVVNDQEMAFTWGVGDVPTATKRLTQGMAQWIGFTGLERSKAVTIAATLTDPTGGVIPKAYFSHMYDGAGVNLDRTTLVHSILGPAVAEGFQADGAVGFAPARLKGLIAEFALTTNGPLNWRTIPAYDNYFSENISIIETSSYGVFSLSWNRYMDLPDNWSVNNTGSGGEINQTMPCAETLLILMPRYWKIGVLRGVGYAPLAKVLDGDRAFVIGEAGIYCRNPIAGTGGVNLLSAA